MSSVVSSTTPSALSSLLFFFLEFEIRAHQGGALMEPSAVSPELIHHYCLEPCLFQEHAAIFSVRKGYDPSCVAVFQIFFLPTFPDTLIYYHSENHARHDQHVYKQFVPVRCELEFCSNLSYSLSSSFSTKGS